jgi:hypothetical protein
VVVVSSKAKQAAERKAGAASERLDNTERSERNASALAAWCGGGARHGPMEPSSGQQPVGARVPRSGCRFRQSMRRGGEP